MRHGSKKRVIQFKNSTEVQIIAQSADGRVTAVRSKDGYTLSYQYYEDRELCVYKTLEDADISLLADLIFFEDKLTPEEIDLLKSAVFYECKICHRINKSPIKSRSDCWWCNSGPMFSIDASMVPGWVKETE